MSNDLEIMQKKDVELAEKLGIDIDIYRALKYSLFPDKKIPEYAFGLYLAACKAKGFDPIKKPYHIVMMKRNAAAYGDAPVWEEYPVIMPGITSYRIDASRTGTFYGISDAEFGPILTEKLGAYEVKYPEWCRIVIYKKIQDRVIEIPAKLYWKECYATAKKDTEAPNDMWRKRPRAMLEKCCEALAYRKGFPEETGGIPTHDEMEGRHSMDELPGEKDITPEVKQLEQKPLSQSYKVDAEVLQKHLDVINNTIDMEILKVAFHDAQAATKGDRDAANEVLKATKERKLYIKQLTPPKDTPELKQQRDEFWKEYDASNNSEETK